jgi:tRNA-dihydrouridine synthase
MPIIGNGNVSSYQEAERMMEETGCDAVMIARAAIRNPWIFNEFTSSHDQILSVQNEEINKINEKNEINENLPGDYWPNEIELKIAEKQYFEYVKLSNSKQKYVDFHRSNFQRLRNSIVSGNRSAPVGSPRTIHL